MNRDVNFMVTSTRFGVIALEEHEETKLDRRAGRGEKRKTCVENKRR